MDDVTVYQCPECNFNADNLDELDSHITENHSNENHLHTATPSKTAAATANIAVKQQQSVTALIANEVPTRAVSERVDHKQPPQQQQHSPKSSSSSSAASRHNQPVEDDEEDEHRYDDDDEDFFNERNAANNLTTTIKQSNSFREDAQNRFNHIEDDNYEDGDQMLEDEEDFFQPQQQHHQHHHQQQKPNNQFTANNGVKPVGIKAQAQQQQQPFASRSQPANRSSLGGVAAVGVSLGVLNSDNHYERQYACKQCEFFTNNPRSILYHRKEFHREKINVHECQYCQYASQYSGKVERHTMLRHKIDIANGGTIAPAASSQNNATLVDESAVGDDDIPVDDSPATLAAVAAANVAKFQCNKCPCKYKRSSDLSKHMRLKHGILSSRYSNAYPELAEQHNRSGLNNQNLNGYGDEIENDENDEELYSDNNANNSVTGTPNGHHHNAHHQTNLTGSANRNVMGSGGIASNNNRNFNQLNQKKIVVQSVASPSSSSTSQQQQQQQPKPNSQPNSQPMPRRIAPSAMASASSSSSSSSSANPYQLQCPYCTYTANLSGAGANDAKADYLVHVKDHLCGKAFRCVLCNSVYKYRGDCVVHLKRKHQKADMIAHSYVDKFNLDLLDASEIYSLLKPKQQDEPENEEKLFGCAYCDYKANYKGDVYKHQTRRHPGTMKQVNVLAMHHSFNGANQSLNGSNVLANCSNQSSANNSANNSFNHGINDDLSKYSGNGKFYANNNNRFYNGNSKGQNGGANRAAYQEEYYNEDEENMIGGEEDEMIDYENENGGGVEGEEMMEDEDEINYEGEENFVEGEEAAAPLDDQDEVDEDEEDFFNERQQLQQQQQLMGVNNGADMMSRYQCKFCAFVAKSHAKLKLHLATHYNLKRYMCPICKRRANFKWDIQKHLRKIHNDFTSEVICLSEIEARKSIDTYMETTNANGGRMVNNLNNGQTDAQSDHSSTTTTTTTTTIGANGNMLNEGKSATAALRAPNSNGSSVNYASSSASSIASQQQQQQQRAQYHQQSNANFSMSPSQFGSPNNANSAAFMGSDTTGNKKFRCTICPYRSNWKADLYRHLRKRHGMQQPGIDDVIVLSADEAANTLEEYERIYGVNVRKRARFDAIAAAAAAAATGSTLNPGDEPVGANENFEANECKRMRTTDSSSVISTSTSGSHSSKAAFEPKYMNNGVPQENYMEEEDDYNQADQMENNHLQQHQQLTAKPEETAANGGVERLPVSIAELNIKPYKCLKCGFRSDRKSDTLRHIRVKHELEPLHAFKFLRIMSIKEASETIEEYESTRLFRKSTSRVVSRDYNLINSLVVSQATAQSPVGLNRSSSSNMAQNHMSPKRMSLPTVPQQNLPPIKTTTTKTAPLVSLDYFRCPICLFKHRSRLVMKKHLANHYHSNEINSNPIYQCNLCGFKAGWQFTVKKHIITSHVANPNAAVVRIEPPKKRPIKKNRRRLQRLMMLTSNGATKASNGEVVNNGEEEYYETHENEDATNINGEQIESHPQVVTKTEFNELNESNGGEVYHNNANMSYTAGDINNEVGARKVESIILTDYEGVQFEATYLVSNGPGTGSGGSSLNYSLNGGASVKKKMFYCETCPYKTNNYCNLKQHLLQHRFRDGFFKCRYCPYFVSMIRLLKQHEVLHEDYVPREGPITKPLPSNVVPSLPILQHRPIAASSVYSFPK